MKLENRAVVDAPPDVVFAMLNDPEAIVGCVPGGALTGRDGDAWAGGVSVKVGPIAASYAGTVRFLDVDAAARSLRLVARGAETRGSGDAEAEVLVRVQPAGAGSELVIDTDLLVRGKIAQFGKGAIGAVSTKILQQFAVELGRLAAASPTSPSTLGSAISPAPVPPAATAAAVGTAGQPTAAPASSPGSAPAELDAFAMVVGPVLQRYARPAAIIALALAQGYVLGRAVTIEQFHRTLTR